MELKGFAYTVNKSFRLDWIEAMVKGKQVNTNKYTKI